MHCLSEKVVPSAFRHGNGGLTEFLDSCSVFEASEFVQDHKLKKSVKTTFLETRPKSTLFWQTQLGRS